MHVIESLDQAITEPEFRRDLGGQALWFEFIGPLRQLSKQQAEDRSKIYGTMLNLHCSMSHLAI